MVQEQVKKIMSKAINRFALEHNVESNKVAIFIHTKSDDNEPLYFKSVEGKNILNEESTGVKNLSFNKDILGLKIDLDLMGRGFLTSNFMQSYFKNVGESEGVNPKTLYLKIGCKDFKADLLDITLYHNAKALKKLTLNDIFPD